MNTKAQGQTGSRLFCHTPRAALLIAALSASLISNTARALPPPPGTHLLYGWGHNQIGQVNGGVAADPVLSPTRAVDSSSDVIQVASGVAGTLALHADGTVWAWGDERMLGDGTRGTRFQPGKVPGLPPIVKVTTGYSHALAIGADGSLWAWGESAFGELGAPNNGLYLPVKVPLTGVVQVTAGYHFSVALRSNGEVWTWGFNDEGQLGQGHYSLMDGTPRRAGTPYGITQISAGHYHTLALRNDGSVWAWGQGGNGQLGDGAFHTSSLPVRVDRHVAGITRIATGLKHSLAVAADGSLWAWGSNLQGQLGNGTFVSQNIPIKIALQAPVALIDGGSQATVAVLGNGTMWAWGSTIGYRNDPAQQTASPAQISGVSGVTQFAIDDDTLLALMAPQPATVPDLQYFGIDGVAALLEARGLTLGSVTPVAVLCNFAGVVVDQDPPAGSVVPFGSAVSVTYVDPTICF